MITIMCDGAPALFDTENHVDYFRYVSVLYSVFISTCFTVALLSLFNMHYNQVICCKIMNFVFHWLCFIFNSFDTNFDVIMYLCSLRLFRLYMLRTVSTNALLCHSHF